jgi:hypothetical protein
MTRPALDLERLRGAVDGIATAPQVREDARALFVAHVRRRQRRRRAPVAFALLVAAAAAAIVVLSRRPAMTFVIAAERTEPGEVGPRIRAGAVDKALRFSDGSTVTLDRESEARVVSLSPDGARIVVERGRAYASVVHRERTRWNLEVGPFEIVVKGTRFEASWDPDAARVRVRLDEGAVVVRGCGLADTAVAVGEILERRCESAPMDAKAAVSVDPVIPVETAVPAIASSAPMMAVAPAPSPSVAPPSASVPESIDVIESPPAELPAPSAISIFRDRYAAADFDAAYRAVESDFDGHCAAADRTTLFSLADAARLTRHPAPARRAYERLRRLHPATSHAARAAFHLGLIATDAGEHIGAVAWFERALAEDTGDLAREAGGRLVEARAAAGDRDGARRAAEAYLARWPKGPHAAHARKALETAP